MVSYKVASTFRHNSRYHKRSKYIGIFPYKPKVIYEGKSYERTINCLTAGEERKIVCKWINKHSKHFKVMNFGEMEFTTHKGHVYKWQRGGEYDKGMRYKRNIILEYTGETE